MALENIDLKNVLEMCLEEGKKVIHMGKLADYIPELKLADKTNIGIHIYTLDNEECGAKERDFEFTMQSVIKVLIFALAIEDNGLESVLSKIGVKPSADPFNSIVKLEETEDHKPLNPYINAGAIACTSLIKGKTNDEKYNRVVELLSRMVDRDDIGYDKRVFESETMTGDTNRSLAYFMKSRGILESEEDVDGLLSVYFKLSSVLGTVRDLAKMGAVFANDGIAPWSGERILDAKTNQIVCAVMTTCGLYDFSGEFAILVGMPAKSGVGGGIVCVSRGKMGIGVSSPALDSHGNSIGGMKMLEVLSEELNMSIF